MHVHRLARMTSLDTPPDSGVRSVSPVPTLVTGSKWSRATWALLVVLCGALFLDGLDISMIGVALPSIGSDLHMAPGSLQWIVSAYVLGYGGLLLLGGLLTELGWRATLLAPAPVALLIAAAGYRLLPRVSRERLRIADLDLAGAFTSTGSLLVLVYAVVDAPHRGWGSGTTLGLIALSVVLMAAFVAIESRHPRPLVRLGILRSRLLVHANISGAVMFGGYVAFQFVVTLYLQNSLDWSPLAMAFGFLPGGLIVMASATRMGAVLERVDTAKLIFGGLLSFVVAYLLFLRVDPSMNYVNFLLPTMLLLGVGFALAFPSINAQATAGVAEHEQGLASGLVNTSIQVGGAIVLAVVTPIIGDNPHAVHGELIPGMSTTIAAVVGVSAAGQLLTT